MAMRQNVDDIEPQKLPALYAMGSCFVPRIQYAYHTATEAALLPVRRCGTVSVYRLTYDGVIRMPLKTFLFEN